MSNCKFSNLVFGEQVKLSGGSSCCGVCGADTQKQTEEILWEYQGHSGDMDLFEAITMAQCPSCGEKINGYGEICGDAGGLDITAWVYSPIKVYGEEDE